MARTAEQDFSGKVQLSPDAYFSEQYAEAREKFRCAAAALGREQSVETATLKVMEPDYTIDVAIVPGSSSRGLAIHSSGVHGVEGYAGSAIQCAALHEFFCKGIRPEVTLAFIHAINPVGMAHHRRWNENNVDLNRNALTEEGFKEVMARDPNVAGYMDFAGLLIPKSLPSKLYVYAGIWVHAIYLILRYGLRHLKRAMVTANYHHQTGIFFGGQELQPSHRLVSEFLKKRFGDVPCSEVRWVDVHTGLGPRGKDVLLCEAVEKSAVLKGFPGADVQCTDDAAGTENGSQASGYELARGFVGGFYGRCFKGGETAARGKDATIIATQEFGTVAPIMVARAMLVENAGYHFDPKNRGFWSTFTRDVFYIREQGWKTSVLERGLTVLHQLLRMTAGLAAPPK